MAFFQPLPIGLLLASPALGLAQTTAPAPLPRLYVGLGVYTSSYVPGGQIWQHKLRVPVQATVGYQLRPRWAVQASLAYYGLQNGFDQTFYLTTGGHAPTLYNYAGQLDTHLLTTSVLGRYTLTRPTTSRLQVDALAGLSWVHLRSSSDYVRTDSVGGTLSFQSSYITNNLIANAGLGLRYRLRPQLEATYTALLDVPLADYNYRSLTPSMALGLQYRFGRR